MTTDTYRVFEMNVTKEEKATIDKFCRFLDDTMDYIDNFELMFYIINAIPDNDKRILNGKDLDFRININIKEGEN